MAKRAQLPKRAGQVSKPRSVSRKPTDVRLLLGVIVAVLVVVIGVVILQMQSVQKPIEGSGRVGEGAAWGPTGAKVLVVQYSDFGCSHCADFALNQGRQLRSEYEATGQVRFEFRNFIIGGATTANAANAAECAADQGRFWDYHDLLYSKQGVTTDPFNKAALKQYAATLGLDAAQFAQCVDSDQHLETVYRDTSDGRGLGINVTPTFFINGEKVEGAIPYVDLKVKIDAASATQ